MTPHSKDERYAYLELGNTYAAVKQKWIVEHSTPAQKRAEKSVSKKFEKLILKEIKAYESLTSTMFACEEDAHRAFSKVVNKFSLLEPVNMKIAIHKRYDKAGKPKKNQKPDFL